MHKASQGTLFLAILLTGCMTASKYLESAMELERQGNTAQAFYTYINALEKKPENLNARVGAARTGQIVVDSSTTLFFDSRKANNHRAAVRAYDQARDIYKKAQGYQVNINWPEKVDNLIQESRTIAIAQETEESYTLGVEAMKSQNYRKAYEAFSHALSLTPNYKDASKRKAEALAAGKTRVGFVLGASTKQTTLSQSMIQEMIGALVAQRDPFLEVISYSEMQALIARQGPTNAKKSLPELGKSAGIGTLISLDIITETPTNSAVKKEVKQGYYLTPQITNRSYTDSLGKKVGLYEISYAGRPVELVLLERVHGVSVTTSVQALSTKNGQVLHAQSLTKSLESRTTYATSGRLEYRKISTSIPTPFTVRGTETDALNAQKSAEKNYLLPYDRALFENPSEPKSHASLEKEATTFLVHQLSQSLYATLSGTP